MPATRALARRRPDRLADTVAPKVARLAASGATGQVEAVLEALDALASEDAVCAAAVGERLDHLLHTVDGRGLARWVLTGTRRHGSEPDRLRAYFRLEDPYAIESLHAEAGAADLEASLPSLTLLLQGLAGRDLRVQARHQFELNAPPARPVLTGRHLLIPDSYTLSDGRDRGLLYRAAVAHAVGHLRHSPAAQPVTGLKPMGLAIVSAIEDARVERLLTGEFPGMRCWFLPFHAALPDASDLTFDGLASRMGRALADPDAGDGNYWVEKARRLFEEQARADLHDYAAFRRLASILANDLGQMRVRFDPQRHAVHPAYRDDNSFLWDHGDRGLPPPPAHELEVKSQGARIERRQADEPSADAVAPSQEEIELSRHDYPEWDYRAKRLRTSWCTVIEKLPAAGTAGVAADDAARRPLPELAGVLRRRVFSRTRRLRRQHEGDSIDLDAAIEVLIDRHMNLAPEPRFFMRPGYETRPASILVLLDLSESTNDRAPGSDRSVLEVEKEAALLLSRTLSAGTGHRLAVHGFSSDTRHRVNYYRLLEFGAPREADSTRRIRGARGCFSTRIGAALRHAVACLAPEPSARRAVLVVTDGAPSDIDVFDPRYLVEDARTAVIEARCSGVEVFGVAVDPAAEPYAQRIFGWRGYRIVDDAARLPAHLQQVCARLGRA